MVGAVVISATTLSGTEPPPPQSAPPQHQFDFVVGNWLVRDGAGKVIATASFSKPFGDFVVVEKWRGAGNSSQALGVTGYVPASGTWRREFIDDTGLILTVEGKADGTSMVMTGNDYHSDITRMHRVTWTPGKNGSVEERWQTSTDDGRSWQEHFLGVFQHISE